MKVVVCPECAGDIEFGIAIKPEIGGCFYNPILNHNDMKLIDVYKCKNCGHSYVETWDEYYNEE
jgi:hypothetical protein